MTRKKRRNSMRRRPLVLACLALAVAPALLQAQLAVRGDKVYTMSGTPINDGVILIRGGKIERAGPASQVPVPSDYKLLRAKVVTPGLVDAHSTVGLTGYLNQPQDQDMLEKSAPIQPELRAIDAYDGRDRLVGYIRGFGVTTIHTGHGPGALISGQTMIAKTAYDNVERATIVPLAMVAATLGEGARAETGKSPGTRAKMIAMLREEFIKAQEYSKKREKPVAAKDKDDKDKDKEKEPPARELHMEMLARLVKGEVPLLVTVHRANDILSTIRLGQEFHLKIVLDGVAEAY